MNLKTELSKLGNAELWSEYEKSNRMLAHEKSELLKKQTRFQQMGMSPDQTWEELVAGNIGDINELIWPFYFTSIDGVVTAGQTTSYSITITQEAPFVCTAMQKSVYNITNYNLPNEERVWLNPYDLTTPYADGLKYIMQDSSAQRQYLDVPINVDHVGNARNPTKFATPFMLLENSNTKITFTNSHATRNYYVKITFFGYRIRIQDSRKLLSLVSSK
jgi:hypothetical protein